MNKFAQAMRKDTNATLTENMQPAYKSTDMSKVLDFYAVAGALRNRNALEIETKMANAFKENPLLATKLLFYLSDIREGLGERRTFRIALTWLARFHPDVAKMNMEYIAHFNRWDSLFVLKGTNCENEMLKLVNEQLREDVANMNANQSISLLAKWMPSEGASSRETRNLARWFAEKLNFTAREYRIVLSSLRDYLKVVETRMSSDNWDHIAYSEVPSMAMNRYRKAFHNRDGERFRAFLGNVASGKEKINASVLYPYNLTENYTNYWNRRVDEVIEAQWKALPNYIDGEHNVLVMADVSGSMSGRPMATSVGLAIYFAERNRGPFQDLFLTFSARPEYVRLQGATLCEKVANAMSANWEMNTDLNKAFDLVLSTAINNQVPKNDMPKAIIVISDMEIDRCTHGVQKDFLIYQKTKFERYGYSLPKLVFWNVNSRNDTFLVDGNRPGVELVSGQSASTFKKVLNTIATTPYEAMLETLLSERYEPVSVPDHYLIEKPFSMKGTVTGVNQLSSNKTLEQVRKNRRKVIDKLF